jgi:DNA-binding transcriptional ArsR family regulator
MVTTDRLTPVFAALADPTRRAILQRLTDGDATVGDLAAPFSISQPAVSKHLKVLESAGLISRSRVATSRLSHLEPAMLREASEYVDRYKRFWQGSFNRLDAALAQFQANGAQANTAEANPAQANTAEANRAQADTARASTARADTAHGAAAQANTGQAPADEDRATS